MKTGDVVYLNSGSPPMTVTQVGQETDSETSTRIRFKSGIPVAPQVGETVRMVSVTWLDRASNRQNHSFPEACLQTEKVQWP